MRTPILLGVALGALIAQTGCGDDKLQRCTEDSFCKGGFVCHPLAKVCVQGCSSGSDCPTTAKTCESFEVGGSAPGPRFCQCQTTELCGNPSTTLCANEERICLPRCHNNVDCTFNRRCDVASGQCQL